MSKINLTIILLIMFCLNCVFAQSGWFIIPSGTSQTLNAVHFMNANTGLIAGNNGIILKTTNSGVNWTTVPPPPPTIQSFFDVFFTVSLDAFIVDDRGGINKSSNAGSNWLQQNSMTIAPLNGVVFSNATTGWVCGNNNTVRFTTNGGTNWLSPQPTPIPADFFDPGSVPFSGVIFLGGSPIGNTTGVIEKTTDLGYNWSIPFQGPNRITDIEFANPTTGFACGPGNTVVRRTTNGGTNWDPITIPIEIVSLSLVSTNPITVYGAGTNGRIIKSTDGGNNFTIQQTPLTDSFFDIFFPFDALKGYAVGSNGSIVMTTTGGITYINKISSEIPNSYSLSQNYPNPFNPITVISFRLAVNSFTSIKIYDILGREITTLVNEMLSPGTYEVEWNAGNYSSGVYYYKLSAGEYKETRKMILIK